MCCFHRRSHIASVIRTFIFIYKVSYFCVGIASIEWSFDLFQGEIFVIMSCSYHVGPFHTHFQIVMHCRTSVINVVAKSIFSVTFVISYCKGCHTKGSMSCVLDDLCCVIKCLTV